MKFIYSSGQRPLDGFTLKRGIGKGGFGEVYFAVSDGGKEVALKLLRGNHEIELRGVAQCLNLKHPNLVNLYDLRTDSQGDHWVVMEYVAGESLHTSFSAVILTACRASWPASGSSAWPAPSPICTITASSIATSSRPTSSWKMASSRSATTACRKSISSSQRTAQTHSVGTVHYMAPEISTGNYDKQIDIYAAGIILYEMLTGRVPFDGESAGEILMKHLTAPPDLSKVPADYVPILAKALSKNPAQRYASMAEMARARGGGRRRGDRPRPDRAQSAAAAGPALPPPL